MTRRVQRSLRVPLGFVALLALACGTVADGTASGAANQRDEPAAGRRDAAEPEVRTARDGEPGFLRDTAEVAMQALATSAFGPAAASACGLPDIDPAGGALIYFGCTPESGPILRAVPARRVPATDSEAALAALLAGPTEAERARGYLSTFGPETAAVEWRLGRRDDLAWVDFDREILEVEGLFVAPIDAAQIVATLGQFEGVERVLILVGGEPLCQAKGDC